MHRMDTPNVRWYFTPIRTNSVMKWERCVMNDFLLLIQTKMSWRSLLTSQCSR